MIETTADRAAFVVDFGVTATWTKSDATTASLTVLIGAKHDLSAGFEVDGTELQTTDYIIEAPIESLPGVLPGETITIGSNQYVILTVEPDAEGWVELRTELL